MSDQAAMDMLAERTNELTEARHEAERWKREAADLAAKISQSRGTRARTEAFRRVLFEMSCYGLVFHVLDKDTPGSRPIPVVVPVGAFAQDDPKTWPVAVEHTCRAAVQAQRACHFEPLEPDERTRLAAREAERELALEVLGAPDDAILHKAMKEAQAANKVAVRKAESKFEVATKDNRSLTAQVKRLEQMLQGEGRTPEEVAAGVVEAAATKHGGGKK